MNFKWELIRDIDLRLIDKNKRLSGKKDRRKAIT